MTVNVDNISSAAAPSVTRLGMVMQHHGPKCHARRLIGLLSSNSGPQEGLFYVNMTVSTIIAALLQPDLIGWYITISWSVLCKN